MFCAKKISLDHSSPPEMLRGSAAPKGLGSARRSASCIPPRLSPAGKELAGAIKNASWASSSPRFGSCQVKSAQMMIWAAAVSQPHASTSHTGTGMCGTGSEPGGHGCCCAKGKLKKKIRFKASPLGTQRHAPGTGCSVCLPLDLMLLQQKIGLGVDEN